MPGCCGTACDDRALWNKLPCYLVNNTWHVCLNLRPRLRLGKILKVGSKPMISWSLSLSLSSLLVLRWELPQEASRSTPHPPSVMGNMLLTPAARAGKKVRPCTAVPMLCRWLQLLARSKHFYFLTERERKGQLKGCIMLGYSASSHPALLRAARAGFVEKDALSALLDPGHVLTELPHMAASALTFITVCGVLSTVGTALFPHRCCSGNYCNLWHPAQSLNHLFPKAYCVLLSENRKQDKNFHDSSNHGIHMGHDVFLNVLCFVCISPRNAYMTKSCKVSKVSYPTHQHLIGQPTALIF